MSEPLEPCGRVLVGRGTDTWDPTCILTAGHGGPCQPGPAPHERGGPLANDDRRAQRIAEIARAYGVPAHFIDPKRPGYRGPGMSVAWARFEMALWDLGDSIRTELERDRARLRRLFRRTGRPQDAPTKDLS